MDWTAEMDRRLVAGIKNGHSRTVMGKQLGVSRSAAIARYNRISGVVFPSDKTRAEDCQRLSKLRSAERQQREDAALDRMLDAIERGADMTKAIQSARKDGVRFIAIAKRFGVTWQAIQQRAARAA